MLAPPLGARGKRPMKRPTKLWYGGPAGELLAVTVAALPFGLGVGYVTGYPVECLITSLAISGTVYALLKLDIAFIHPLFRKLPPNQAVAMETATGLLEHILGAWLAFTICNWIFGRFLQGALAWILAGGTVITVMVVHAITYTMHSHAEIKRKVQQEERLRAMATEAELKALKAQINPHFLFNTLNTIAALIHTDPPQAEATVERLAEMFRYVLADSERGWVPLREELAFVDGYLEIEKVRYGGRLRVTRDVAPEALEVPVPGLILQPLVENAVRHGSGSNGRIDLTIRVRQRGEDVVVSVADQGPGMPSDYKAAVSPGLGLHNVDERLIKTYGEAHGVEIRDNDPQGTIVTLRIPAGGAP